MARGQWVPGEGDSFTTSAGPLMAQRLFPNPLPLVCPWCSEHGDFIFPLSSPPLLDSLAKDLAEENFLGRKAILFSSQSLRCWVCNRRY